MENVKYHANNAITTIVILNLNFLHMDGGHILKIINDILIIKFLINFSS